MRKEEGILSICTHLALTDVNPTHVNLYKKNSLNLDSAKKVRVDIEVVIYSVMVCRCTLLALE